MVSAPSLQAIQDPATSTADLVSALQGVKNDIVGHDQRKEVLVKSGIVDSLVGHLSSRTTGKRRSHTSQSHTQEDDVRLQATLVLGSLANGGTAFVAPLLAAGTPKALLDVLLCANASPKLVTAALQTLKSVSSSWAAATAGLDGQDLYPLELFTPRSNDVFLAILRHPTPTTAATHQLGLVSDIIALSATSGSAKALLAHSSILEALAALLASYAITSRHVDHHGDISHLPSPPSQQILPSILSAICTIVTGSTYHVHRFLLSTPIRELFANVWPATGDQRHLFGPRYGFATQHGEPLLPPLHVHATGTTTYYGGSRAFPALSALQPQERRGVPNLEQVAQGGDADHANAVCSWLLVLTRSMQGHSRLVALTLLALVNNAVDADGMASSLRSDISQKAKEREKQMMLLAVPLAVTQVRTASEGKSCGSSLREQQDSRLVKEQACGVLSLLICENKDIAMAAVDAGAIKHASSVLKKSFDNVPLAKAMWSANKSSAADQPHTAETRRMGGRGLPAEILHAMRCRRGALEALAAIAAREDTHRKAIVEAGVVSCIIDSLKPYPADIAEMLMANRGQIGPKDGNTTAVILSACRMAKTMSRSVSLLRTSLIDAGIAKPISQLLQHRDMAVQLAATDVAINLLSEFSPMREDLIAEGILKTLTEHARSSSPALRLYSLWALKHLILSTTKEIKVNALEELGTGWLVAAIEGEQREAALAPPPGGGVSVGLSTPNAAGEQVDILNPSSMDVDEPADDDDEEYVEDDEDGELMYDEQSSTHYQASQLRSTLGNVPPTFNKNSYLSSVREIEQNTALHAKRDDIAVQEHALDFMRNLLSGDDCSYMADHLISQIGSAKIFDMLTTKLLPLPNSARLTGSNTRQVYNPTELVLSTVHIINHFACASPRHKQLLIAQKPLLQAWVPHFSHMDRKVRVMSVWAVNSLTWIEDDSDRKEARQRALELRAVGIEGIVKSMAQDLDLDVKERVKTAVRQLDLVL